MTQPTARSGLRPSGTAAAQPQEPATVPEATSGLNPTTSSTIVEPPIENPFNDEQPFSFADLSSSPLRLGTTIAALRHMSAHLARGVESARFILAHPQGLNPNMEEIEANLLSIRETAARVDFLLAELSPEPQGETKEG